MISVCAVTALDCTGVLPVDFDPSEQKGGVAKLQARVYSRGVRRFRREVCSSSEDGQLRNVKIVDAGGVAAGDLGLFVVRHVRERIPKRFGLDPIRDIQVLCPMNRGGLGARSLNIELQKALNPPGEIRIERFGWTFCPGDKVMQIENDYDKDVYNGDLGVVSRIDRRPGGRAR
jgi:ATP-dependent RecD-like DNA helicase SH3 domain